MHARCMQSAFGGLSVQRGVWGWLAAEVSSPFNLQLPHSRERKVDFFIHWMNYARAWCKVSIIQQSRLTSNEEVLFAFVSKTPADIIERK